MTIDFNNLDINTLRPKNSFEQNVVDFIRDWFSSTKTVYAQTSGSTGSPKAIEIEKEKMINSAQMTCDFLDLKAEDTALLCLPTAYISGKMMVVRSILRKMKLATAELSASPLKNISSAVDFCAMTPLQVENSLEKIHLIKKIIVGGAQVSDGLCQKIKEILDKKNAGCQIFETYGMTETLSHIALREIYPNAEKWFSVLPGVEISKNRDGCLEISAPKINDEKILTHDIIELEDSTKFRFLGRTDNVINSGGAKIFPEELEAFLKGKIPHEMVFIGVPDEILGEKLTLIIEGEERKNLKVEIMGFKFEKSFHRPKEIIFINQIPRTENGKVDRIKLRKTIVDAAAQKK